MAGSVNIPLTTLTPGTYHFPHTGGAAIADIDTKALLTIDRTPTGGLNDVAENVVVTITNEQSNDGGNTWFALGGGVFTGGIFTDDRTHQTATVSTLQVGFSPGANRQVRSRVDLTGGSFAVTGTLSFFKTT